MILSFGGKSPRDEGAAFVADNATVQGDVLLKPGTTVWYGAVLRGDESSIHVGAGSNIQDNAVLHCDADCPAVIGRDVTVGHGAILHGCSVEDTCLIGMGAILLNGCTIGAGSLVAAGALVLENTVIPDGMVAMGVPAKVREAASPALVEANRKNAEGYVAEATAHAEANK